MPVVLIYMIILVIIYRIYVKVYKKFRNYKYKLEIVKEGKIINRDINVIYSPSVVSYLYNQNIELEKDLISDILNLYARKIIKISKDKNNGKYILRRNETVYEKLYFSNQILENDKYILDTIIKKRYDFKYEEWENKIKKVYREYIIKKDEKDENAIKQFIDKHPMFCYIFIPLSGVVLFSIWLAVVLKEVAAGIMIGGAIWLFIVVAEIMIQNVQKKGKNIDMYLTENAKNELKKWMQFENFIKEYTLLKDKKLEEIIIYDRYIPYAMVLDVNQNYKEELLKILNQKDIILLYNDMKECKKNNNSFTEYFQ